MNQFKAISVIKLLAVTFSLFITNVFASNITSGSGFAAEQHGENGILTIADKNEVSNLSYNEYQNFNVLQPLIIYNGSNVKSTDKISTADAAELIIIESSVVQLNSNIKIIGAPADLLIISNGTTPVNCNNCSFSNVGRLTIAHGVYLKDGHYAGDINTNNINSKVEINGLTAPGVLSVELIGKTVNVSGTIDTNLRADNHPNSGMIINEQGNKVIGSGGVNIYTGPLEIGYNDLHLKKIYSPTYGSGFTSGNFTFSGTINSASIAITSPTTVTIPDGSKLNTLSDALSSSTRNGQFYAPLEGIFITTMKNAGANINIEGALTTDNSIALKSREDINIANTGNIVLANGAVSINGLIQTTTFINDSESYKNTGNVSASDITVTTQNNLMNGEGGKLNANNVTLTSIDKSVFNSYGAEIKASTANFFAEKGSVINGSKTNVKNYDSTAESLSMSLDSNQIEWGIKPTSTPTGIQTSNLSAHILANTINIKTKHLENINPYSLAKPTGDAWNSGISVNTANSNQVSIQAENQFNIIATNYILNSSAIIALNQNGSFNINSPKFINERYHIKADAFKVTELILSDNNPRTYDSINSGVQTQIINYSPPARLYSFGELKFNHTDSSLQAEFYNVYSYFEAFKNLYFYKTDVHTLSVETSTSLTSNDLDDVRQCIILRRCTQTYTKTSAEAETLFSVHGNVYGVNPDLPSESNFTSDTVNISDEQTLDLVNEYFAVFASGTHSDDIFSYIKTLNVNEEDDVATATITTCRTVYISADGGHPITYCSDEDMSVSINQLLDPIVNNNEFNGTEYTYNQLLAAATLYVQTLPLMDASGNVVSILPNAVTTPDIYKRARTVVAVTTNNDEITIVFTQHQFRYRGGPAVPDYNLTHTTLFSTLVPYITAP